MTEAEARKVIALVAAVFFICFESFGDNANDVSTVFGGKDAAAIIANANSLKAWRTLGSVEEEQGKRASFNPADYYRNFYRKSGDPIVVFSSDLVTQVSKALLDRQNYSNMGSSRKQCEPEPGVVVTFSEGNKSVDVFFCFECKILEANHVQSDFDRGCKTFVRIIKKVFPNDRTIQSLKDS